MCRPPAHALSRTLYCRMRQAFSARHQAAFPCRSASAPKLQGRGRGAPVRDATGRYHRHIADRIPRRGPKAERTLTCAHMPACLICLHDDGVIPVRVCATCLRDGAHREPYLDAGIPKCRQPGRGRPDSRRTPPAKCAASMHASTCSNVLAGPSVVSSTMRFTPNGFDVSKRVPAMMRRKSSVGIGPVPRMPRPPAFETAATRSGPVTIAIPADTSGRLH